MLYFTLPKFTKSYQNKKIMILISLLTIILLGYCFIIESGDIEYFYPSNSLDDCIEETLKRCKEDTSLICKDLLKYC